MVGWYGGCVEVLGTILIFEPSTFFHAENTGAESNRSRSLETLVLNVTASRKAGFASSMFAVMFNVNACCIWMRLFTHLLPGRAWPRKCPCVTLSTASDLVACQPLAPLGPRWTETGLVLPVLVTHHVYPSHSTPTRPSLMTAYFLPHD